MQGCAPEYNTCMSPLCSSPTFLPLPWPVWPSHPESPAVPTTLSDAWSFCKCRVLPKVFSSPQCSLLSYNHCSYGLRCSLGMYVFPWFTIIFYVYVTPPLSSSRHWSPSPYHCRAHCWRADSGPHSSGYVDRSSQERGATQKHDDHLCLRLSSCSPQTSGFYLLLKCTSGKVKSRGASSSECISRILSLCIDISVPFPILSS